MILSSNRNFFMWYLQRSVIAHKLLYTSNLVEKWDPFAHDANVHVFLYLRAGIKFKTPTLVVPISNFLKNQRKLTYKEGAKITKFELDGGLKLIIHKLKLCSEFVKKINEKKTLHFFKFYPFLYPHTPSRWVSHIKVQFLTLCSPSPYPNITLTLTLLWS